MAERTDTQVDDGTAPAPSAPRWASWVSWPLALAGVGLSAYLTYVHYTAPASLACPDTGIVNCTKVTTSPESMLFGVLPVALAGLVYFVVMAALVSPWGWRSHSAMLRWVRLLGAGAGLLMVLYLIYAEFGIIGALCLYCTVVHAVMVALFVAVLAAHLLHPLDQ